MYNLDQIEWFRRRWLGTFRRRRILIEDVLQNERLVIGGDSQYLEGDGSLERIAEV